MARHLARRLLSAWVLLLLPAVLTGTVTDSTGAVLSGVTVVAVNEATGNRFEAVTDERGIYRISARGTFNGLAIPSAADLQVWFPDPFNADT